MKLKTLRPLLGVLVLLLLPGPRGFCATAPAGAFVQPVAVAAAPDIASLQTARQAALESVAAERAKWMSALETWYLAGLDKILAERTQAGDLDGVVAVKAERERIIAHAARTQEPPASLRALQSAYEASLKKTGDELARRTTAANAKYLTDLEALQKRVTMSGDIEQAVRIKNERTRFAAELAGAPAVAAPPPVEAPPAASPEPTAPAGAPPATGQGNDVASLLAGKWRFTNTRSGWTGIRTFNKDGTFKMDDGKDAGTWKVEGDQVHVSYNFGDTQDLALPIDPAGVNVKGTKGKTLVAVKEAP